MVGALEMAAVVLARRAQRNDAPGCPRSDANERARLQGRPSYQHLRGCGPLGGGSQRQLLLDQIRQRQWASQVVGDVLRSDGLLAKATLEGSTQSTLSVLLQEVV